MKTLTIDISSKCNLNCKFCYQEDNEELSVDDILGLVYINPDFDIIEIGGGEPFLYSDIVSLMEELTRQEKKVHLATNATLIPKKLFDLEDNVQSNITVQVSLPAGTPELYGQITGRELLPQVLDNIPKIKERFQTVASTAIYQENFDDVRNILKVSYGFGIPLRVNLVYPVGKARDVELLTPQQLDYLKGLLFVEGLSHPDIIDSPLVHPNGCYALESAYGIEKTGTCPLEVDGKKYINVNGEAKSCEFIGEKEE